jgi:hypothetical protein
VNQRYTVGCLALVALFGACNVYDTWLFTDEVDAGPGSGGALSGGGSAGDSSGLAGTSPSSGGSGAAGGTSPEGGEGGGDGPIGGTMTGGATSGGNAGNTFGGTAGASGAGGSAGSAGGASGDAGTAGASAGSGGSGAGGSSGAGAGGSGGGGPIVQLMGTATADSEETSPTPHPAVDGNDGSTTTRWCAANGSVGHYWTLDLGAVHLLSRFEVMWEYPSQAVGLPYGYVVSVSTDGTTFTPSIDRSANTETVQTQTSDFPPSTSGRHVRITVTTLPMRSWASFYEARVFGQ